MSKLAEKLVATQTGEVKLVEQGVTEISQSMSECLHVEYFAAKEYRLGAAFQVKGFVTDSKDLQEFQHMARRQIIEEVFGEFRPYILAIERALYNRDISAARSALQKLENEMFY